MSFVSLHNHSHYSILDALPSPKALLSRAKELGHPAVALTDHGTFSGMWDAYKASKDLGIKLIVGCEFYFTSDNLNREEKLRHVILIAKNDVGYRNLLSLNTEGFEQSVLTGRKVLPIIDWNLLEQYSEGVICLTGSANGILAQSLNAKNFEKAEVDANRLISIFGKDNLGIEVQPHTLTRNGSAYNVGINQIFTNYHLIQLAKKLEIRVVPTCNAHYLKKEDAGVHDILLSIGAMQPAYSNARLRYNVSEFYLKTREEVQRFFARNFGEDFASQMCDNTLYFAEKCEEPDWISPSYSNPKGKELPVFAVKDAEDYGIFTSWLSLQDDEVKKLAEDAAYLRYKCFDSFEKNFKQKIHVLKQKDYIARIEEELDIFAYQGFSSYMLIVADYIEWARKNDIPIGPGRGSGGGSIVGYLLGIHKADPLKYNLIFARFQNRERKSPPDIDQDVGTSGRGKLIGYIQRKYGNKHVAFISNFSRITPKVYARDIARSAELGGSRPNALKVGEQIAEAITGDFKKTTDFSVLRKSPLFAEYVKEYPALSDNSEILGKIRALSTHAAALVISHRPLVGLVPLRKDREGNQSLEYDKDQAEDNGLLKVDILGLSTLDLINSAIKLINQTNNINLNVDDIDFESYDKKTYDLISSGDCFGVFQLGTSGGTIDLCKKIKPKNIEDLAIITTLARPAAATIREDFIKTREGRREFKLLHPSLEGAFKITYGFGLFDESILQLGKDVAGWSLNESDRIRKMIKEKGKNPEKDAKLRAEFINGAIKNGISADMAPRIWDEVIKLFQSYTFNKSHAIMYSFISYLTAYLKAHYPVEFLLANLMADVRSNAPDAESNIDRAKAELRAHGVQILPPNINTSQREYSLGPNKSLLTGLDAMKYLGDDAINEILEKRPFKDFNDFMYRCDTKKMRSTGIQALAASGALDSFNMPRRSLYLYCSDYRKKLQVWTKRQEKKKKKDPNDIFSFPWKKEAEWSKPELFALEKYYLGEAFACSKKEAFGSFFSTNHATMQTVKSGKNKTKLDLVKAEIKSFFELKVKKENSKLLGQEMAKVTLEDENGVQCGMTIFPEAWADIKKKVKATKGKVAFDVGYGVQFAGTINVYENETGIILDAIHKIVPPPQLPTDLKAKKLTIEEDEIPAESSNLSEDLEDFLFNQGLVNFEDGEENGDNADI